ncbi:MAG: hypothetical protein P8020_17800 [Acidobacteriota bacterium]|jgi:hypothetical protein
MTITLGHAVAGVFVSGIVLLLIAFLAVRTTKKVFPVRCVHCWMHDHRETVITFAEESDLWGICPECIDHYWHFSAADKDHS